MDLDHPVIELSGFGWIFGVPEAEDDASMERDYRGGHLFHLRQASRQVIREPSGMDPDASPFCAFTMAPAFARSWAIGASVSPSAPGPKPCKENHYRDDQQGRHHEYTHPPNDVPAHLLVGPSRHPALLVPLVHGPLRLMFHRAC